MDIIADKYKALVNEINSLVSKRNYKKSGNSFYLFSNENWGILNIQKSVSTSNNEILFTINLGVCSSKLLEFQRQEVVNSKPDILDCQWKKRIGFLIKEKKDNWWKIDIQTNLAELITEVCDAILNFGLIEIENHLSNDALKQFWISGNSDGLTNFQRLLNLSFLLKYSGEEKLLQEVISELVLLSNNREISSTLKVHLTELDKIRS